MFRIRPPDKEEKLKPLSEKEIQKRLYGYSAGKESAPPAKAEPAPQENVPPQTEPKQEDVQEPPAEQQKEPPVLLKKISENKDAIFAFLGMGLAALCILLIVVFTVRQFVRFVSSRASRSRPAQVETVKEEIAPSPLPEAEEAEEAIKPYTIQVGVYNKQSDAKKMAMDLDEKGLDAYIVTAVSSRGRERFRIYVGAFSTSEAGESILAELKNNSEFKDSFLRRR